MRTEQIEYYKNLLKDDEVLLLKSKDSFFKNHYISSPLNVLTNFSGTEGEAIINKKGEIKIFVDTRYHLLVDKQVFSDIEVIKMPLGESFFDAFKKIYKKGMTLFVEEDVLLSEYLKLDKYFNLKTYKLKEDFLLNDDYDSTKPAFKIEEESFSAKIEKIKAEFKDSKVLVFDLDVISYLVNLRSFQTNFSSNTRSILFLDFKTLNNILFINDEIDAIDGLKIKKLDEFNSFISSIEDEIYFNPSEITLKNFLAIAKPREIKNNILNLAASIKPIKLINDMKDASNKLDRAIFNFKKKLKEGLNEAELVELFEAELFNSGLKCPSFKTILAIGENSASIHYSSYDKNKILKKESLILLDCGGYSDLGMATDITRTLYFGDNPKEIYKKIYTNVLKSFIMCFLNETKDAKKLDLLARDFLQEFNKDGFFFDHGLGHGIGTSCHQNPPRLSMSSKDIIKPYQTHSIEPGLYGKNDEAEFGVRIENCVYFDSNYKRHSLSKYPFEEVLIDFSLLNNKEKEFVENWNRGFYENI